METQTGKAAGPLTPDQLCEWRRREEQRFDFRMIRPRGRTITCRKPDYPAMSILTGISEGIHPSHYSAYHRLMALSPVILPIEPGFDYKRFETIGLDGWTHTILTRTRRLDDDVTWNIGHFSTAPKERYKNGRLDRTFPVEAEASEKQGRPKRDKAKAKQARTARKRNR